jgi:hypothetical protein
MDRHPSATGERKNPGRSGVQREIRFWFNAPIHHGSADGRDTMRSRDTLYLRGVEERVHHSLVLKCMDGAPSAIRAGLRVADEEDLDNAKFFSTQHGMPAEFVEVSYQYAYIVNGIAEIIRACDVGSSLGYGDHVEFGAGRHSLGHSYGVYLLDPDRHRVELLPHPIYYGDADDGPIIQELIGVPRVTASWRLPPRASWLQNASPFEGTGCGSLPPGGREPSLEAYFGMR